MAEINIENKFLVAVQDGQVLIISMAYQTSHTFEEVRAAVENT